MTAHELANALLAGPNVPVVVHDEWTEYEVTEVIQAIGDFNGANDEEDTPRDNRPYVYLRHCDDAPPTREERERAEERKRKVEEDRKRLTPEQFALIYAEIRPLTPEELTKMTDIELGISRNRP